jgi:L-iditol 2-dehydrogenase
MKAWVLHGLGDLRLEDVPQPSPKAGEVLVRVRAAGICSSDVPRIFTSGAYHYPLILGHEFAGELADGRRVGVYPLIPCRKCPSCHNGDFETCENYDYIGSRRDGAFAEFVAVPEENLLELPAGLTFEQAALLEPAAVALHAVSRLELADISSVAIIGAGTIGRLIAQWLAIYGVTEVALLGRNEASNRNRYDACVEAVGTVEAFQSCLELARPNGQILLVGNPVSGFSLAQKLYWQILRKQLAVCGTWNSHWQGDWQRVLEYADKLDFDSLITHRLAFAELGSAVEMMYSKREKYGKVMVGLSQS